jgi:pentatricopeptide repeat protein
MSFGRELLKWLARPTKYTSFKELLQPHRENIPQFVASLPLNAEHEVLKQFRLQTPRSKGCPQKDYYDFLRQLYPINGPVNHGLMYSAYTKLPKPQPLYIDAHHFEDFLATFISAQGHERAKIGSTFNSVANAVRNCGMELSLKERNVLLYLKNYSKNNIVHIKKQWYNILQDDFIDVSTANIYLKFATRHGNYGFLKDILNDMAECDIKMDRISYDIVLNFLGKLNMPDDASELLVSILHDGIVLDISILNTMIEILVNSGEIDTADEIIKLLMARSALTGPQNAHQRREYLHQLQYLDSLKVQTSKSPLFIPSPIFETFAPSIRHYASIRQLTPYKVLEYLNYMDQLGITIPLEMAKDIVLSLRNHPSIHCSELKNILVALQKGTPKLDYELIQSLVKLAQSPSFDRETAIDLEQGWNSVNTRARRSIDLEDLSRHSVRRIATAI